MGGEGSKANRDDLIRSAAIPGFGIVVGLGALWKNQVQRGLTMMGISSVVLFAVVMVARSGILLSAVHGLVPGTPSVENELAKVARTITLNCPKMVDANTRLDRAVAGPGRQLTFFYTFPKLASAHVPAKIFGKKVAAAKLQAACKAKRMEPFFSNNIAVIYKYQAKDGRQLGTVEISRKTCGMTKSG